MPPSIISAPTILVSVSGCTGDPSHPKCDSTIALRICPASSNSVIGPAPICGMIQAIPNTSVAPIAPAVRSSGFTCRRPFNAPACQPVAPITTAVTAPMHQNSALPTRGLPNDAPTFPFIARCTVSTTPMIIVRPYRYDLIWRSFFGLQSGKSTPSCIL
jgi:hypothetical protein